MRLSCLAAAAALSSCALGFGRVKTLSRAPSFRARALTIAATSGAGRKGGELARALVRRLKAGGFRASALEESDSVLAGAALGPDIAGDPSALAEVRRATGADGIVFLTLDADWSSLDVSVLDASTGEVVLHASARLAGAASGSSEDAASAAAEALSGLASNRGKAASAARAKPEALALPDVGGDD